jgi:hypothetical protein
MGHSSSKRPWRTVVDNTVKIHHAAEAGPLHDTCRVRSNGRKQSKIRKTKRPIMVEHALLNVGGWWSMNGVGRVLALREGATALAKM